MQPLTNFAEVNQYLTKFYRNARVEYTLDTMRQLMDFLGNPQERLRVVHVAGTSGKTSTAYYIAALLSAAGHKTGLTVSPHVDELNERLQINSVPVPEAPFCAALSEFIALVQSGPVKASWFEMMIGFVYWYFDREQVEYAVVEVGLGGLKDGTNVATRPDKICVITDIGLDHVNVLGATLPEIAKQKIGIVQPHNDVFSYKPAPEVLSVFQPYCGRRQAALHLIDQAACAAAYQADLTTLPKYQRRNWLLAYAVYQHLQKRDNLQHLTSKVLQQVQHTYIPGRMEIRHIKNKTVVMDGAHNIQKMTAFLSSFQELYPGSKPAVLLSISHHKDYQALVPLIASVAGSLIITTFTATQDAPGRAVDPRLLSEAFQKLGMPNMIIENHTEALRALLRAPEEICVITGSFYLLSQVRNNKQII